MNWLVKSPLEWETDSVRLIDQRRLPGDETWVRICSYREMADAIRSMMIRGAPALGVAAAFGVVLAFTNPEESLNTPEQKKVYFTKVYNMLYHTRPTAVNLPWALNRMRRVFEANKEKPLQALSNALLYEARRIQEEDREMNRRIGQFGADLFNGPVSLLTLCNTGTLATAGFGTALGVVRTLWDRKKLLRVYACETRPLLQGARLTMWELQQDGISGCLITDAMAGFLLRREHVDAIITGADRIAANGDTANKIGTYTLAILAKHHKVPFYVAAPYSTIDLSLENGDAIPIEERDADEVRRIQGIPVAPLDCPVWNPSFDITPGELISGIITERGVIRPPYDRTLNDAFSFADSTG